MIARHPPAAPIRSAPYNSPIGPFVLVSASVTTTPDKKNGMVNINVAIASGAISEGVALRTDGNGMTRLATWQIGRAIANARAIHGNKRAARSGAKIVPPTNTSTAPAAMPSIATDTARKDRWYHVSTESRRVSSTSSIRVASVTKKRPDASQKTRGRPV